MKQKWIVGYHLETIFIVAFINVLFLFMGTIITIKEGWLTGLVFIPMTLLMCYLWTRTYWYRLYSLYHTKEEYEVEKRMGLVD
jgi:uncharacterized protein (DUF983 family)